MFIGNSKHAPPRDYSIKGINTEDRLMGAFNGISIIATTYASGIIPEIQVNSPLYNIIMACMV